MFSGQFTADANSINDHNNIKLTVYPNPASNYISLKLPNKFTATAYIYDINGRQVASQALENSDHVKFGINNLSKGYYFVKLQNGNTNYTGKFIKK